MCLHSSHGQDLSQNESLLLSFTSCFAIFWHPFVWKTLSEFQMMHHIRGYSAVSTNDLIFVLKQQHKMCNF